MYPFGLSLLIFFLALSNHSNADSPREWWFPGDDIELLNLPPKDTVLEFMANWNSKSDIFFEKEISVSCSVFTDRVLTSDDVATIPEGSIYILDSFSEPVTMTHDIAFGLDSYTYKKTEIRFNLDLNLSRNKTSSIKSITCSITKSTESIYLTGETIGNIRWKFGWKNWIKTDSKYKSQANLK